MTDYLDEIEINLYYNVTNRFSHFIKVFVDLNTIEERITHALQFLGFLKRYNQHIKEKMCKIAMGINTKMKVLKNQKSTLPLVRQITPLWL
jgi:hypothetical protein